jgi:hypothetical protein
MSPNSQRLTKEEISTLLDLLKKCEPGNLPSEIFEALAKLAVYPAIEFVPLRRKAESIEVLLFPRANDDPVWPGMLHIPGTVLRPTDMSLDDAIGRLIRDELKGLRFAELRFTGLGINDYVRGRGLGIEYWAEVLDSEAAEGTFYDITKLPKNFIYEQSDLLDRGVKAFKQEKLPVRI